MVLRWHRRLVTKKWDLPEPLWAPPVDPMIAALIERMARENEPQVAGVFRVAVTP